MTSTCTFVSDLRPIPSATQNGVLHNPIATGDSSVDYDKTVHLVQSCPKYGAPVNTMIRIFSRIPILTGLGQSVARWDPPSPNHEKDVEPSSSHPRTLRSCGQLVHLVYDDFPSAGKNSETHLLELPYLNRPITLHCYRYKILAKCKLFRSLTSATYLAWFSVSVKPLPLQAKPLLTLCLQRQCRRRLYEHL